MENSGGSLIDKMLEKKLMRSYAIGGSYGRHNVPVDVGRPGGFIHAPNEYTRRDNEGFHRADGRGGVEISSGGLDSGFHFSNGGPYLRYKYDHPDSLDDHGRFELYDPAARSASVDTVGGNITTMGYARPEVYANFNLAEEAKQEEQLRRIKTKDMRAYADKLQKLILERQRKSGLSGMKQMEYDAQHYDDQGFGYSQGGGIPRYANGGTVSDYTSRVKPSEEIMNLGRDLIKKYEKGGKERRRPVGPEGLLYGGIAGVAGSRAYDYVTREDQQPEQPEEAEEGPFQASPGTKKYFNEDRAYLEDQMSKQSQDYGARDMAARVSGLNLTKPEEISRTLKSYIHLYPNIVSEYQKLHPDFIYSEQPLSRAQALMEQYRKEHEEQNSQLLDESPLLGNANTPIYSYSGMPTPDQTAQLDDLSPAQAFGGYVPRYAQGGSKDISDQTRAIAQGMDKPLISKGARKAIYTGAGGIGALALGYKVKEWLNNLREKNIEKIISRKDIDNSALGDEYANMNQETLDDFNDGNYYSPAEKRQLIAERVYATKLGALDERKKIISSLHSKAKNPFFKSPYSSVGTQSDLPDEGRLNSLSGVYADERDLDPMFGGGPNKLEPGEIGKGGTQGYGSTYPDINPQTGKAFIEPMRGYFEVPIPSHKAYGGYVPRYELGGEKKKEEETIENDPIIPSGQSWHSGGVISQTAPDYGDGNWMTKASNAWNGMQRGKFGMPLKAVSNILPTALSMYRPMPGAILNMGKNLISGNLTGTLLSALPFSRAFAYSNATGKNFLNLPGMLANPSKLTNFNIFDPEGRSNMTSLGLMTAPTMISALFSPRKRPYNYNETLTANMGSFY